MPLYPTQWTFKCWEQKPSVINLLNVCKNIGAYSPTVLYTIAYTAIKSMHSMCGCRWALADMYLLTAVCVALNIHNVTDRKLFPAPVTAPAVTPSVFPCVSFLPCCVCVCMRKTRPGSGFPPPSDSPYLQPITHHSTVMFPCAPSNYCFFVVRSSSPGLLTHHSSWIHSSHSCL